MNISHISRFVLAGIVIGTVLIRLFFPHFGAQKHVIAFVEEHQIKTKYLVWSSINGLLLGATVIISVYITERLLYLIWIALAAIFISVLACNKTCFGVFLPIFEKEKQK